MIDKIKNINKTKKIMLLVSLVTILSLSAVLVYGSTTFEDKAKTSTLSGEIREKFVNGEQINWVLTGNNKKRVWFENTGRADVFLRVSYGDYWSMPDGSNVTQLSNYVGKQEVATKSWTAHWCTGATPEWVDGKDGWFYYTKVLQTGQITEDILSAVKFNDVDDIRYQSSSYDLVFQMELVQASDDPEVSRDAINEIFQKDITMPTNWETDKYNSILSWQE